MRQAGVPQGTHRREIIPAVCDFGGTLELTTRDEQRPLSVGAPSFMDRLGILLAVCVGSGLAHVGTSTMPFQIGTLIDGSHRSRSQAGVFGFLEVGALALGMMLISLRVARVSPLRFAACGCVLIGLANAGLWGSDAVYLQMPLAVIAGLGYGLVYTAMIAGAAASAQPDRIYAIGNFGALLIIAGTMKALPAAGKHFGPLGDFAVLAILAVIGLPFLLGFRASRPPTQLRLSAWRTPGAAGLLIAWVGFSTGGSALYSFSEQIGKKSVGLPAAQVATVLATGVLVSLLGTAVAAILGRRLNRRLALTLGIACCGVSCLTVGLAPSLPLYAAGMYGYWMSTMFLYSYLLGTAATLDPSGRVGTLAGGLERLGNALGALLGGVVAEHMSYAATGVLGFIGCMVGLLFGLPMLFRALKARDTLAPCVTADGHYRS